MAANAMLHDSGQTEWYTPSAIVEAARRCMGGIDLDPASCEAANVTVSATRYYTVDDAGLLLPWAGRVWMNHPFGAKEKACTPNCTKKRCRDKTKRGYCIARDLPGNAAWINKLIAEYHAGNVTQACMICNASTSEAWFQPLYDFPICFMNRRPSFIPGAGQTNPGAQKGCAIVYMGQNVDRFAAAFHGIGRVMLPYRIPDTKCAICHRGFMPKRVDALYCSAACKQKAVRLRISSNSAGLTPSDIGV